MPLSDGRWRVLLVEDDSRQADLVCHVMATIAPAACVDVAPSGEAAVERLRDFGPTPPDLVLLDIGLPGVDGWEVLASIRSDDSVRHTPVVILTAAAGPADTDRAYRQGANALLAKPSTARGLERLLAAVATCWLGLTGP